MKLSQGHFYGRTLYRCDVVGLTLTDCVYAPSQQVAEHCHASSYLSVLLRGAYNEIQGSSEIACTTGTALFHPVGESHRDIFGSTGGGSLASTWSATGSTAYTKNASPRKTDSQFEGKFPDWRSSSPAWFANSTSISSTRRA